MKERRAADAKKFNRLLTCIACDEEGALEQFYTLYGKLIYAAACSLLPAYTADEVVDEVLAKIWQNAEKYRYIENPVSWLYTVTVNLAKDKLRSQRQFEEIFDVFSEDKNIDAVADDDSFYSFIKCLDGEEQFIMICRFVEDMTFKEIAKDMKKPLNTVTSAYYRALKKIKENIDKN